MHDPACLDEHPPHERGHAPPSTKPQSLLAVVLSLRFVALSPGVLSIHKFIGASSDSGGMAVALVYSINMAVISLATLEFGLGVG